MPDYSIDVQRALQELLQGASQTPTFTNPIPFGVDTLKALFQQPGATAPPTPIDTGATIPVGATVSVPTFQPLPPITQEIGNILSTLQGFGIGAPPPAPRPTSLLEKNALGLQGFGAGTQGQGPQF